MHLWKGAKFAGSIGHPMTKLLSGSAPGPRWRLCPQTPVIGSCSAIAMVPLQPLTPSAAYECILVILANQTFFSNTTLAYMHAVTYYVFTRPVQLNPRFRSASKLVGTVRKVSRAGSMQLTGVRPSVCPNMGPQQQIRCCRFAAVGPALSSSGLWRPKAGSAM